MCFIYTDTAEDMQPDPDVSRKVVGWIEKLGLDQVCMRTKVVFAALMLCIFLCHHFVDGRQTEKMTTLHSNSSKLSITVSNDAHYNYC